MDLTLAERVAVVETKVDTLTKNQADIAVQVNAIYDHVVASKANRKLAGRFFAGIAGFVAVAASLVEIFRK